MVHIVGLYKCGTTWLLRALAAHPQVAAFREFDPLLAGSEHPRRGMTGVASALDYLRRRPQDPSWMARRERLLPKQQEAAFRDFFLGRGWLPVMGVERQREAACLSRSSIPDTLAALERLTGITPRRDEGPLIVPAKATQPVGARALRRQALLQMMESVGRAEPGVAQAAAFYRALADAVEPGSVVVCKAADQVMHLEALREATPGARFVAIVRDGRDAAVSARHYEALMRREQAPWRVPRGGTVKRLLSWSVRAAKLGEHARRGEVIVLRYEDLHRDFVGTLRALLHALALSCNGQRLAAIEAASSFQRTSGGRAPGEAADHIVRRGIVGEWREAYSALEAGVAWRTVGRELAQFGYTRNGSLQDSPLVLTPLPGDPG